MKNALLALPLLGLALATPALSDVVHADDVIIKKKICVGSIACLDGEIFGNEAIKIENNGPEILFDDTNGTAWSLDGDDDGAGAIDSFSINNESTGAVPFAIAPAAPTSSFFISPTGEIGMGTVLPLEDIHIVSDAASTIRLERSDGLSSHLWDLTGDANSFRLVNSLLGYNAFYIATRAPANSIVVNHTGNVGFGLNVAEEKLHIQTNAADTDAFALFDAAGSGSDAAFLLRQNGVVPTTWEFRNQEDSGRLKIGIAGGNSPLKIDNTADNNLLKLGNNANPDAVIVTGRLLVNNTQMNVPDYVFADDYALRPLADVRSFIDTNSHLPEVPSAADIAQDGVDMTEMQMVLLKKVEELTLYTLAQQAEIAELRQMVIEQSR